MIYAIVETGGKQYKVAEGQTIKVEKLEAAEGGSVELNKVLMIADGANITTGRPAIEGARVLATATATGKGDKVIAYKFKAKVRYRRNLGHRQPFTSLTIDKILPPGAVVEKPKRARRKKADEAPKEEAAVKTEEKTDGA